MYNEKDAAGWRIMTRNYWLSRNADMRKFLEWIEGQNDREIEEGDIKRLKDSYELMIDMDVVEAY